MNDLKRKTKRLLRRLCVCFCDIPDIKKVSSKKTVFKHKSTQTTKPNDVRIQIESDDETIEKTEHIVDWTIF